MRILSKDLSSMPGDANTLGTPKEWYQGSQSASLSVRPIPWASTSSPGRMFCRWETQDGSGSGSATTSLELKGAQAETEISCPA